MHNESNRKEKHIELVITIATSSKCNNLIFEHFFQHKLTPAFYLYWLYVCRKFTFSPQLSCGFNHEYFSHKEWLFLYSIYRAV